MPLCNLVGTCNDLLCFTSFNQRESIYVGNPITRELVSPPKRSKTASPEPCTLVYGFGFDFLTKKNGKVVRIFHSTPSVPQSSRFEKLETRMTAEVYTLGATGSWSCTLGGSSSLCADISKDEFIATPHPRFASTFSIAELRGCLSVVEDIMSSLMKDGLYSYERRTLRRKTSGFPTWLDWVVCSGFRGSLVPCGASCDNGGGEKDAAYFLSATQNFTPGLLVL